MQFVSGFSVPDGEDVVFLPASGNLAVINSNVGGTGMVGVEIYTTSGTFLQALPFSTTGLAFGEVFSDNGLSVLPNGNLIVASSLAIIYEININTGEIVLPSAGGYGGFDVLVLGPDVTPNGIVHRSTTNNLWVASENGDMIAEITTTGEAATGPFTAFPAPAIPGDAEGLGFSPGHQSLLVADDTNDVLVELSLTGAYIQTIDLATITAGSGFLLDPEGVATDHATGRIFVANDDLNGRNILVFSTSGGGVIDVVADQMTVFRGLQIAGTLSDSFASDNAWLKFNPGFTINNTEAPVWLIFDGTLPLNNPASLEIVMEANAGTPGLTGTIEAWNWISNRYDVVNVSNASFNTDAIVTVPLSNVTNYVQAGTNAVRTRIGWRKTAFTINYPWEIRLDQLIWRVN